MDVQSALGNAGAPFEIDWNGKKIKVLYRVQRIKAEFERWAKQQAMVELVALKSILPADDYARQMRELLDAFKGVGPDGKPLTTEIEVDRLDENGEPSCGPDGKPLKEKKTVPDDYSWESPRLSRLRETNDGKLAHVRTMIDGGVNWPEAELIGFLLDRGDELAAYCSACEARVEELLKDLGESPDPKAVARRLRDAGWWE